MSLQPPSIGLLDHFSALEDPRQSWRVIYPLPEIMLLLLSATSAGMEDFVQIRLWGRERLEFLRRFLPFERGIPAHDTRRALGKKCYHGATSLLITADCGGSNGARVRLWKRELQVFANETGLAITVSHYPPGTSKWNRIEHRLFAFITQNWRGKPLTSREVIIQLIRATTTRTGLNVWCGLDENEYPKGVKVADREVAAINLERDSFHGEWNYTISPITSEPRTLDDRRS